MGELRQTATIDQNKRQSGLTVQDLILIAVLLAAGAVLKLTVASLFASFGMKPNFIIAMYCLAIILTRPKVSQAMIIGIIAGLICQIPMLNATPLLNIPSEFLGALACGLLIKVNMHIAGKVDIGPFVTTLLSTVVSGGSFACMAVYINVVSTGGNFMVAIAAYVAIVAGTAIINAIMVQVLTAPLRKVLKRQDTAPKAAVKHVQEQTQPQAPTSVADFKTSAGIEVRDFSFKYREGDSPTVHDINLSIPSGAFVGITGAAGSGKSTLTYALNGIIPHCYPGDFYGSILVGGHDTVETSLTDLSRIVGSVCQDIDSQMVASVVEDEMLYGLENFDVPHDQIPARVDEALAEMGISDLRNRTIASLSGGQKQKLAIASILALHPAVLVLDEPTAELDPASSISVFQLLKDYSRRHGTTVIVVEQKIALLSEFSDLLVIMENGGIRYAGTPTEVLAHSDDLLNIGVNCPRSTTLTNRLRDSGLVDGDICRNVSEACTALEEVLA